MGYCAQPTPDMGDLSVEVRRESFVIHGDNGALPWVYPDPYAENGRRGSVEFPLGDIPKLRAILDQAERVAAGNRLPSD